MAFGGFSRESNPAPMAEINMVPLIDVMLVLLVIFIVTAPLLTHAVKVDLPRASSEPNRTKPQNVQLAIDDRGIVYWNGEVLDRAGWRSRMDAASAQRPPMAARCCRRCRANRWGRTSSRWGSVLASCSAAG